MKKVSVENYNKLESNIILTVETLGFTKEGDKTLFGPIGQCKARLIRARSKQKEIVEDGNPTGKFETVSDAVVYERLNPDLSQIPGYHYTVTGCGMFRLFVE